MQLLLAAPLAAKDTQPMHKLLKVDGPAAVCVKNGNQTVRQRVAGNGRDLQKLVAVDRPGAIAVELQETFLQALDLRSGDCVSHATYSWYSAPCHSAAASLAAPSSSLRPEGDRSPTWRSGGAYASLLRDTMDALDVARLKKGEVDLGVRGLSYTDIDYGGCI